jgi:hypothetical protein
MSILDTHYLDPPNPLRLKSGEDKGIEQEAAAWLAKGRAGVRALSEKTDYLTFDQLQLRARREVSNHNGVCDESLVRGMFRRTFNPLAGSRPTGRMHAYDE